MTNGTIVHEGDFPQPIPVTETAMGYQKIRRRYAAAAILDVLIARDGELIKRRVLARETGLTMANMSKGLAYLRDELATVEGVTYVAERGPNGGVALTHDMDRADAYVRLSAKIARRQIQRVLTGTVAQMVESAAGAQVRQTQLIEVGLQRLIEDLDRVAAASD